MQVGHHHPRVERVDPHSARRQLQGEEARELIDRRLAHAVRQHAGLCAARPRSTGSGSCRARHQVGDRQPRQLEERAHVHVHGPVPVLDRRGVDRSSFEDPGGIHKDVEPPPAAAASSTSRARSSPRVISAATGMICPAPEASEAVASNGSMRRPATITEACGGSLGDGPPQAVSSTRHQRAASLQRSSMSRSSPGSRACPPRPGCSARRHSSRCRPGRVPRVLDTVRTRATGSRASRSDSFKRPFQKRTQGGPHHVAQDQSVRRSVRCLP